jgi:hypothetical protein
MIHQCGRRRAERLLDCEEAESSRFPSPHDADAAVRYVAQSPVVGAPDEDTQELLKRQEEYARKLERDQAERAKLYGA